MRLIDGDGIVDILYGLYKRSTGDVRKTCSAAIGVITNAKTVDEQEIKTHAKREVANAKGDIYRCSNCKCAIGSVRYCPNCGAKIV